MRSPDVSMVSTTYLIAHTLIYLWRPCYYIYGDFRFLCCLATQIQARWSTRAAITWGKRKMAGRQIKSNIVLYIVTYMLL